MINISFDDRESGGSQMKRGVIVDVFTAAFACNNSRSAEQGEVMPSSCSVFRTDSAISSGNGSGTGKHGSNVIRSSSPISGTNAEAVVVAAPFAGIPAMGVVVEREARGNE